jgi:hypothetical protein
MATQLVLVVQASVAMQGIHPSIGLDDAAIISLP